MPWSYEREDEQDEPSGDADVLSERFLRTRTILLSGEINKDLAEKVIRHLLVLEEADDSPISVLIDSPGGDVDAGFAIFDMFRFVKPEVHTVGIGLVASAAALILLASPREYRFGLPHSRYLIHQPMSGMQGSATDIEIHAREIEKTRHRINEIISEEAGRSIKQVSQDTDRDYWLLAEEAKDYGLISSVISHRE